MAIKKILTQDTIGSGFRAKYNETVDEIPVSFTLVGNTLTITKFNNQHIEVDLQLSSDFEYAASDLSDGYIILDHDLDTLTPDVIIYGDNVRLVEVNTRVELWDNGNGLNNSVKITHYDGPINYNVKIKK